MTQYPASWSLKKQAKKDAEAASYLFPGERVFYQGSANGVKPLTTDLVVTDVRLFRYSPSGFGDGIRLTEIAEVLAKSSALTGGSLVITDRAGIVVKLSAIASKDIAALETAIASARAAQPAPEAIAAAEADSAAQRTEDVSTTGDVSGEAKADERRLQQVEKRREAAASILERARAKASKKGINVDGALAVAHTYDDGQDQFLVLFPDRVELIKRRKTGSLFGSGAGTEAIPLTRISSTQVVNSSIWAIVEVYTSGNSIKFKADQISGPAMREAILDQMNRSSAGSGPTSAAQPEDLPAKIRKLAELHADGILTDEEFDAKKTELLERM
ncbi:SHOCT domain-containing protein [Microbacterium deminutum]|uniref:SHOCT domain-containing protein n=1 Tax=Microbacterium deminutum TaxID=344164 RepID=A0ABN2RD94_9MICO